MRIALIGTVASSLLGFRRDLIISLISRGHIVYAFASDYDAKTEGAVADLGAIAVPYKMGRSSLNPFADVLSMFRLTLLLRKISPDLVFSYFVKPVVYGTIAAMLAGVKRRVGMLEGLGYAFTPWPEGVSRKVWMIKHIQIFLYRMSLPLLENVIFLNSDDPADLVGAYRIPVRKVSVLGGIGVNLHEFKFSLPPTSFINFVFVGRLIAEKGIYDFLSAAKIVKAEFPNIDFSVLGAVDHASKNSLKAADLAEYVASGLINAPGHVDDITGWLAQASVFVLPSFYREGVPRSTQEAMAIGRAVITSNSPGCRDTVEEGVNGFLISPHSVDELVERMRFFILNEDQISVMGRHSRAMAEQRFDSFVVNERLIGMFEGL